MVSPAGTSNKIKLGGKGVKNVNAQSGKYVFLLPQQAQPLPPLTYYQKHRKRCILQSLKYYYSHRKHCIARNLKYQKEHPLRDLLCLINQRCNYPKDKKYKYYGGKGIRNYLSYDDLVFLWNRDKGFLLKQPSIDRKNNNKDYTLQNCQFIEMDDNRKKRG